MCANSEGTGETARMRRLASTFPGRLCDKYDNLMSWLKCFSPLCFFFVTGESKYNTKESLDELKMKIGNLKVDLREEMVKEDSIKDVS